MTLVPLPTLVFPIPFPLFWREQIDHPEKLESIRFSLPHPFDSTAHAKSAPTSRLPTIVSAAANRWWENHIAGACPPKYNRFSRRREFRSGFFADLRADVRVPVWVWEEEVQSQPIVRLSAHVSYSYFHFTLADHVFEIACKRRSQTIERSFADAKELHGLRYARYRGLAKVREQCLLIAVAQNIKKMALLLSKRGKGFVIRLIYQI